MALWFNPLGLILEHGCQVSIIVADSPLSRSLSHYSKQENSGHNFVEFLDFFDFVISIDRYMYYHESFIFLRNFEFSAVACWPR